MKNLLPIAILSFGLSLGLTYALVYIFKKKNFKILPIPERWHTRPTPSFGGMAVFFSFIVMTLVFCKPCSSMLPILFGGALIFLIGFFDDIYDLKPYTKLLLEIGVSCIMILWGVHMIFKTNPVVYIPLTIFWIVGVTNAFNLLDNMDGLASGVGAIASFFIFLISYKLGLAELYVPSIVLSATLAAFLMFNFNPAKIFLGDCGSLFVGFLLATLSIKGSWQQASNLFLILLTPLLILGIPIFDTFFVSFQRKMHGLSITHGGKDHSSHRLVMMGWSEKKTVVFLYAIALVLGLIALAGLNFNVYIKSVLFAIILITIILFATFIAQAKVYAASGEEKAKNGKQKILGTILYKRRMLDVTIDSALIIIAYIAAYLIKFDGVLSQYNKELISRSLPIVLFVKLASLYLVGLYKGIWRYIDFEDSVKLLKGALLGSAASVLILLGFTRFVGYSRAMFLIDFVVFLFLLSGTRILLRILRESFFSFMKTGKRVLLIGAGEAGKFILSEMKKNKDIGLYPVGILDDDETKHGKRLMGVPVLGSIADIKRFAADKKAEKILIAIPSASDDTKERIANHCRETNIEFSLMKGFKDLF